MPRPSIPVNKAILATAIRQAEVNGPLKNRNALNAAVAKIYNRMVPDSPITMHVVYTRLNQWNESVDKTKVILDGYQIKTERGKRGRTALTDEQKAKMLEGRRMSGNTRRKRSKKDKESVAELRKYTSQVAPSRMSLVSKINSGSRTAAIKLFCLQCVGYEVKAVRDCTAATCPLHSVRPYRGNDPEDLADLKEAEREVMEV